MRKISLEAARRVANVLQDLFGGCYSFWAILHVAEGAYRRLPMPIDYTVALPLPRKRGGDHSYSFQHYLQQAFEHPEVAAQLKAAWFASAIVTAADALSAHNYFNRPPLLEMIYHLRNGIAHGNKFTFTPKCVARLKDHPANTFSIDGSRSPDTDFNIDVSLSGTGVLFDYLGPGDVIAILQHASVYMFKLSNGDIEARQY